MKKCLRCDDEMVDGCTLRVVSSWPVTAAKGGFRGQGLGDLLCRVCPQCGYVELYLKDVSRLNQDS